jgi:S-sulfo-L-cysteine synthase (O-acetyl-L-serine-dependent)
LKSILDTIGNTPLVEIKKLNPNPKVKVYAKLEGKNPGGSVKDRAALWMIKGAMDRNEIKPGTRIIEATSGNTGIALALIASIFNLDLELVMPEGATRERVLTMQAYGAKIVQTPRDEFMEGAIDYVASKVKSGGYIQLNQFANPDNVAAHYNTTGPEIWRDTNGHVSHFVSAMGTTGTIMGVSSYLKEMSADVQIIGVHPAEGALIPGIRRWPTQYLPKIFNPQKVDIVKDITLEDASETARLLAKEEGIMAGVSSGGAAKIALDTAAEIKSGLIVFIVCDRGDRYLTSGLYG